MGLASVETATRTPSTIEAQCHRFDPAEVDCSPHDLERRVRRVLTSHPGLNVSSLVVRRVADGVCLSGVVESIESDTDVCGLVKQVRGVNEVLNRLLVRTASTAK